MEHHCNRICITPTRNEAWIIQPFLAAAKTWATQVVVADQGSTDGTLEHLQKTFGVNVVINASSSYDENYRQQLLLNKAREIAGKRILVALDADEALSANCLESQEWQEILDAKPGTILRFRWVNILPGFQQAWIPPGHRVFGFIDDGSEHHATRIHSTRVPQPANAPVIDMHDVVVLHFQYVLWERMLSKHRWYQAWEYASHRQKSPLQIFREYHHMYGGWETKEIKPVKPEWLEGYDRVGIDFRSLKTEKVTWWDREICQMLCEYGPAHFRRVDIWDKDWNAVAHTLGFDRHDLADPRSFFERCAHQVLRTTQKNRARWGVRALEYVLRSLGW